MSNLVLDRKELMKTIVSCENNLRKNYSKEFSKMAAFQIAQARTELKWMDEIANAKITKSFIEKIKSDFSKDDAIEVFKFIKNEKAKQISQIRYTGDDVKYWKVFFDTEDGTRFFITRKKLNEGCELTENHEEAKIFSKTSSLELCENLKKSGMPWKRAAISWFKNEKINILANETEVIKSVITEIRK